MSLIEAESLADYGVAAILRNIPKDKMKPLADAIFEGGVRLLEVTLDTEGAFSLIQQLSETFQGKAVIGAGTVLDEASARTAIKCGARFIVSPHSDERVIQAAKEEGGISVAGAFTPTEIMDAIAYGADAVKLFPAAFAGPAYIRQIRTPLPRIPIMVTGGIHLSNMAAFLQAGADFVGVGSCLYTEELLNPAGYLTITENARKLTEKFSAEKRTPINN